MEKVIIAVDAGGSKTKVCVIDALKNILFTTIEGSGSPAVVGDLALENIQIGVRKAYEFAKANYELICISMGISGLGAFTNIEEIRLDFEQQYHVPTWIDNDASIALYSIVTDLYDEGILVLSGTGSAVFGLHQNETVLVGGFGHMLTEVGSAFTTVRDLICQIIRQYETNQSISPLGQKLFALFNITSTHGFRAFVYNRTKREIAAFANFVVDEAKAGDLEAIELLKKAGRDLASDVIKAHHTLKLTNQAVIGFRGGFIIHSPITQEALLTTLHDHHIDMKVVNGDSDPIYGVYYKVKRMNILC